MILVGNQRGGATDLARHLMKAENERVEVHEIRGFIASDLLGAFRESYAISRSTQCKQHLYSLSLSPPKGEGVSNAKFEEAIIQAEEQLGLQNQPRAIVFHEKRGDDGILRRHAHAVWCRIDTDRMKAVQMSFSHRRLQSLSRDLYLEHGWQIPRGLLQQGFCDPRNFTLEEWQQAKRRKKYPRVLKAVFQDAWAMSDSREAFANALIEKGYALARGNRRGFVAVDHTGEVYSLSRWTGEKPKAIRARLGDEAQLAPIEDALREVTEMTVSRLDQLRQTLLAKSEAARLDRNKALSELTVLHYEQEQAMKERHALRLDELSKEHAAKHRTGLLGLLDRISGRRKRITEANRLAHERMHRSHGEERARLRSALDQGRFRLEQPSSVELRTDEAVGAIFDDIEKLRNLRSATNMHPRKGQRRARDRLGRE